MVDHVAEGNTHRSTAARFKVSVKFVNDMVKLMKTTGGPRPLAG
jgi:transposase